MRWGILNQIFQAWFSSSENWELPTNCPVWLSNTVVLAEIRSLWYVSGLLLLCPFCSFPPISSEHRKSHASSENTEDVYVLHMLLVGRKKHQPVLLLKTQPNGLESRNLPGLFCKAHEFSPYQDARSVTLKVKTPTPPFPPHSVPSRGAQGPSVLSGGQSCLRNPPSLGCISCHPPFTQGAS